MLVKSRLVAILSFFAIPLFLLSCGEKNSASIKGLAEEIKDKTIYLERIEPSRSKLVDSAKADGNGRFTFTLKFEADEPSFVVLKTDSLVLATLLLEKGEKVNFSYANATYQVEGSEGSSLVKELNDRMAKTIHRQDSVVKKISEEYNVAPHDTTLAKLRRSVNKLFVDQKRANIRFIVEHSKSFASIMAIYQQLPNNLALFGRKDDIPYFQLLVDSLQQVYPKAAYLAFLKTDLEKLKKDVELQTMLDKADVAEGTPDISLPDKNGKEVALSSLRGNIVLLYFWASAMEGSQLDNRELINIYNKYSAKGFTIYQVSLDTERAKWIKQVEVQELPWINVCDGGGLSSYAVRVYNVQALPASYLIGKNGEIIGKNLFDKELEKKLAEVCR